MRIKVNSIIGAALMLALSFVLVSSDVFAQPGGGGRRMGRGDGQRPARIYDVNTVQTLKGEVLSVENTQGKREGVNGVHITLKSGNETVIVHIGPQWYLSKQELTINQGDKIEVTGSKVTIDGKDVIIAANVTKGDKSFKLRDEQGFPLWRGAMRK